MADRVFLSLWLPHAAEFSIAPLAVALRALPASATQPGIQLVRVTPLDWAQPPLCEERFSPGIDLPAALALLRENAYDDFAFEAEIAWDLWLPAAPSRPGLPVVPAWHKQPSPVRATLLGSNFDHGASAPRLDADLLVDLGTEELFLAPDQPANAATRRHLQENAAALVAFSNALATAVHPLRRQLWSEAEEDLATRLTARLQWVQ